MKKVFFILSALAVLSLAAPDLYAWRGGPGKSGHYGPDKRSNGYAMGHLWRIPELKNELGLSDQQVSRVTEINKSYNEKYDQNRGNRAEMRPLHDEHQAAVEKVLTKEQLKKLEENNYYCRRGRGGPRR